MLLVTMDIFSGLRNPSWELQSQDATDLLARVIDGALPILDINTEVALLGYRGFEINATGRHAATLRAAGLPTRFRISSVHTGADPFSGSTESLLIEGAPGAAPDEAFAHALERLVEISKGISGLDLRPARPVRGAGEEPKETETEQAELDPSASEARGDQPLALAAGCTVTVTSNSNFDFWNLDQFHRLNNNCYNYASNRRTNTFAQPGRGGTGHPFYATQPFDITGLQWGVAQDGWVPRAGCFQASYEIALVFWPGVDFHFYRKVASANGQTRWAHKRGQDPAKNTDEAGQIITSALTCNRGAYTVWGGYRYHRSDIARNIN